MLPEQKIRSRKNDILQHVEHCNKEISKRLEEVEEYKQMIHDAESRLQMINEILKD